jgi:FKBP-type peptidyl-prolyl cis-trans isomerase FkpA
MKYLLILLSLSFVVGISSCKKKSAACTLTAGTTVAPANEEAAVTSYLSTNNITNAVELNGSGMYYVIETPGTAEKPASQCAYVTIKYTGSLPNGTVFDKTVDPSTATFQLGGLIEGWKRGLPLIGAGGKIKLYIPGSLAYGANGVYNSNTGVYTIPPNSMLIFSIELVSFSL